MNDFSTSTIIKSSPAGVFAAILGTWGWWNTSGFGYDPVFIPDSDPGHRTYAQMTSEEKNKISHRRRAVDAMRDGLGLR